MNKSSQKPQYFSICGYWKDDPTKTFEGYVVKSTETVRQKEDDSIFFYGLSEADVKEAIKLGKGSDLEFVITSYKRLEK